jgi:hypothetical protein
VKDTYKVLSGLGCSIGTKLKGDPSNVFSANFHIKVDYKRKVSEITREIRIANMDSTHPFDQKMFYYYPPLGFPAIMETVERENALAPVWRKATFAIGENAEAVARNAEDIMVEIFIVIIVMEKSAFGALTLKTQRKSWKKNVVLAVADGRRRIRILRALNRAVLSLTSLTSVRRVRAMYELQFDLACDVGLNYAPRQLFSSISY